MVLVTGVAVSLRTSDGDGRSRYILPHVRDEARAGRAGMAYSEGI